MDTVVKSMMEEEEEEKPVNLFVQIQNKTQAGLFEILKISNVIMITVSLFYKFIY